MGEESRLYTPLWHKYRPMILQLMSGTANGPQQYKLFPHEFKALSKKDKVSFTFTMEAYNGRAVNNIKSSQVALDLLFILQQSQKASQLLRESIYEFSLDKSFVFHITRKEVQPVEIATPA
jgi:hypothetical protein